MKRLFILRISKLVPTRTGVRKEYFDKTIIGTMDDVERYVRECKGTLEGLDWFDDERGQVS